MTTSSPALAPLAASLLLTAFISGCVGPATPFGAMDRLTPSSAANTVEEPKSVYLQGVRIRFKPDRMVLHTRSNFEVEIRDPNTIASEKNVQLLYDGHDATAALLKHSEVEFSEDRKTLTLRFPTLRLPSDVHNRISVSYKRKDGGTYVGHYEPPLCPVRQTRSIASLPTFDANQALVSHIEDSARSAGLNPTLIAGIVAQESAFNPKAVSWAKALGLTQITPIAEAEIIGLVNEWPRHPNINDMSYLNMKYKIATGEINERTEWRLDPEKSILGGVAYLDYLVNHWRLPDNSKYIQQLEGSFQRNFSEVILASYNSGSSRVKNAIINRNTRWRDATNLKEANKYVNRVSSYCYHFSSNKELQ